MKLKKLVIYSSIAILLNSHLVLINNDKEETIDNHSISTHYDDINFIAHRGLSSLYLDNTLSSVTACNNNECIDGVEIDVRLTKDNEVVLMHDSTIEDKKIIDYTLEELKDINLKYGLSKMGSSISKVDVFSANSLLIKKRFLNKNCDDNKVCTLDDVLLNLEDDKELLVELKFDKDKESILMDLVAQKLNGRHNIIIQSFDANALLKMKEKYPQYKYQIIISKEENLDLLDLDFDGYAIKYTIVDEDLIIEKLNEGKSISFWTIDSYDKFISLYEEYEEYNENISYISDVPDVLCYTYKERNE